MRLLFGKLFASAFEVVDFPTPAGPEIIYTVVMYITSGINFYKAEKMLTTIEVIIIVNAPVNQYTFAEKSSFLGARSNILPKFKPMIMQ